MVAILFAVWLIVTRQSIEMAQSLRRILTKGGFCPRQELGDVYILLVIRVCGWGPGKVPSHAHTLTLTSVSVGIDPS